MESYLAEPLNADKRAVTEWRYGDKRSFYKLHNTNNLKNILNTLKLRNSDNYPIRNKLID